MRTLLALLVVLGCSGSSNDVAVADAADETTEVETGEVDSSLDSSLPDAPEIDTMTTTDAPIAEAEVGPVFQPFDINHVLGTGQSLSVGAVGAPALSTMQPFSNLMFSKGVIPGGTGLTAFAPLVESGVETISSGMANNHGKGKEHAILISAHGIGGTAYSGLKKGTTAFSNGIAQVRAAKALAEAMKRTYVVRAVTNVHGESDHNSGNMAYGANLAEWQRDYETDVKAITGQTLPIPMLHTQMSSWTKYGEATSVIPQAQLDASRKSGGKLVLVGPKYTALYVSDGVHLSNLGYRLLGEYYAKVYRRVVLDGAAWTPLQPKTITRLGVTITLELDVPVPPLVLDTTLVTDPGSNGFEVVDDGKPAKIMTVALAGPTSVKITLAAMPTGKAMRLRYAYTGVVNAAGGAKTGPRGNLRDSDETTYASMNKLFNWCVHFDEPIP